jgi:hypothetical protein
VQSIREISDNDKKQDEQSENSSIPALIGVLIT